MKAEIGTRGISSVNTFTILSSKPNMSANLKSKILLIILFNDSFETHLTFRPVVRLAFAPDLRLLVFLSLLGDLSACLEGEEEAMETLPGSLNGFGQ